MMAKKEGRNKKAPRLRGFSVVRPGLEPGLFWTKTRRVASYTIGQQQIAFLRLGLQK